jgi:colicin import membrane protein
MPDFIPVTIVTDTNTAQLAQGQTTAVKPEESHPFVDTIGDRKTVEDPTAKLDTKRELKATTDRPEPTPPAPTEKKPAEPTHDPIADAIKKDDNKKTDSKKADPKPSTPPKKEPLQPKFDPRKVAALLDKQTPQRLAATGDTPNETLNLGASNGHAAHVSQTELGAMIERLQRLWNPPAGAGKPEELNIVVRIKLNPDGRLAAPPMVLTSDRGKSAVFAVARDAAARAVLLGQPFDMLRPEHYEEWKEIDITFDYATWMRDR